MTGANRTKKRAQMTKTTLAMNQPSYDLLRSIAAQRHMALGVVVEKALSLFDYALKAKDKGHHIMVEGGEHLQEIVIA